jgi:hypothetical protein
MLLRFLVTLALVLGGCAGRAVPRPSPQACAAVIARTEHELAHEADRNRKALLAALYALALAACPEGAS